MGLDIFGKGEKHEYYPLKEPILVNNQWFNEIDIWQHYKILHSHYINDDIIKELVKQLNNTDYPHKSEGYLKTNDGRRWKLHEFDKFYLKYKLKYKAYRLVWLISEGSDILTIVHCLRKQQHDIKNYEKKQ